jgi:SAM-dependent methyltransferase
MIYDMQDKTLLIQSYYKKVKLANKESTKKEALKDLLNRLYSSDKDILGIIDKITLGAEYTILNIPRKDKNHRGSADTLFNKIIIEFENDLKITLNHAKEQLAGYLLGQFSSGEGYNFTLIASDCITWKVFAPDVSQIDKFDLLKEDELILNEVESASITLNDHNAEDFYYWIDRFLFKEQKQRATLKRIEESFGYQSHVFIESFRELTSQFALVRENSEVQVSFEQWKKFLSIAYGSFDASETNFLIHTYLSVFSKMLAYAIVSNDDYIDDKEMKGILTGDIFFRYNIQNFVDNDFYYWIGDEEYFKKLKKLFRLIAQEISSYDFIKVDEDILKGVYQELIDLDTRHSLGEYYTPDWLCERIVNEYEIKPTNKVLDPACGSGSFLRAAIHRIRQQYPETKVEEINDNIYGIDIHPLSVQIAKTTLLLALGKEITTSKKPIYLNIILANSLLAPEGVKNLFGSEFIMQIDKEKLWLNTQVFEDVHLFDEALDVCEQLAERSINKKKELKQTFENNLHHRYKGGGLNQQVIDSFYQIYETLKLVKEKGRDSIWKFIVQNLYKPYFLKDKFDLIIGNPPWFTYSAIKNEDYQDQISELAEKYNVKPISAKNFPNLEIASIFLSYCSSYFLKETGKLSFVLPRSFFSADHHDNTRSGKAKGFKLTKIWDLNDVSPLFRIPCGVFFAEKAVVKRALPANGLPGITFKGNLPSLNCNLAIASQKLTEAHVKWYYIMQGKSSAFSNQKRKAQSKVNPYKRTFKRGAELSPRAFYFIQLLQDYPPDWDDRIINVKTSTEIQKDAKKPWIGIDFTGKIESNFIFRTALSKSILPFTLYRPDLVTLPITVELNSLNKKVIKTHSVKDLLESGFMDASQWFLQAEEIWATYRTEKNKKIGAIEYINWNNKLTSQDLNAPYLVIYNASAKDANATIVKRDELDLSFIVDTKAYALYTFNLNEAYYLAAILNSTVPNLMMKDFQSKGLFGARDVHKKILDIYFPKYDEKILKHLSIAELSEKAHKKVTIFLSSIPPTQKIKGIHLGNIRLQIKKYLGDEIKMIDQLVKQIMQ